MEANSAPIIRKQSRAAAVIRPGAQYVECERFSMIAQRGNSLWHYRLDQLQVAFFVPSGRHGLSSSFLRGTHLKDLRR